MTEQTFRRNCTGVKLQARGKDDLHVMFTLEVQDDECWYEIELASFSSHWLSELIEVLQAAKSFCESQTDPDIHGGIQYGWRFRGASR